VSWSLRVDLSLHAYLDLHYVLGISLMSLMVFSSSS